MNKRASAFGRLCLALLNVCAFPAVAQRESRVDQEQVVSAITAMFTALHDESSAGLHTLLTPDFYLFENGRRLDADGVFTMLKNANSSGKDYERHVTRPDVHVSGPLAWVAYVSCGSITTDLGKEDITWLESGGLLKDHGKWRIDLCVARG